MTTDRNTTRSGKVRRRPKLASVKELKRDMEALRDTIRRLTEGLQLIGKQKTQLGVWCAAFLKLNGGSVTITKEMMDEMTSDVMKYQFRTEELESGDVIVSVRDDEESDEGEQAADGESSGD